MKKERLSKDLLKIIELNNAITFVVSEKKKLQNRLIASDKPLPIVQAKKRRLNNRHVTTQIEILEIELEKFKKSKEVITHNIIAQLEHNQSLEIKLNNQKIYKVTRKSGKLYVEKL